MSDRAALKNKKFWKWKVFLQRWIVQILSLNQTGTAFWSKVWWQVLLETAYNQTLKRELAWTSEGFYPWISLRWLPHYLHWLQFRVISMFSPSTNSTFCFFATPVTSPWVLLCESSTYLERLKKHIVDTSWEERRHWHCTVRRNMDLHCSADLKVTFGCSVRVEIAMEIPCLSYPLCSLPVQKLLLLGCSCCFLLGVLMCSYVITVVFSSQIMYPTGDLVCPPKYW